MVSIYYIYYIYKKKPGKKKNKNEKGVSRETMKNLIDSLGISHRRFAELYGIPYRTVAAWYTGERTAPEWVKSLIVQIIELKKQGEQIPLGTNYYMIGIISRHGYNEYVCDSIEKREEIKRISKANHNGNVSYIEKDFIELIK